MAEAGICTDRKKVLKKPCGESLFNSIFFLIFVRFFAALENRNKK
jgi:hypothetical protein